jgi:hypothetical protein
MLDVMVRPMAPLAWYEIAYWENTKSLDHQITNWVGHEVTVESDR